MGNTDIQGTVTDATGSTVSGAVVEVFEQDGTTVARVTTDSNGNYLIDTSDITGDGPWHLTCRYTDGNGNQYNSASKPFVSADLTTEAVIDDFEDNDISEYTGDTGQFTTVTSTVQNGTYSLEGSASGSTNYGIWSNSGLNVYPSTGDTFRIFTRIESNPEEHAVVMFATQSGTDAGDGMPERYQVSIQGDNNRVRLAKNLSSGFTVLDTASFSVSTSTWYDIEITWTSGNDLTATVYDASGTQLAATNTVNDTSFTSGGFGYQIDGVGSGTNQMFWDYARIL